MRTTIRSNCVTKLEIFDESGLHITETPGLHITETTRGNTYLEHNCITW